ncbi:MAG: hypothetical protein PHT83_00960 [Bacilli bacterium]|nr:hypothetical protein [Bacilli bacterium]
MIFLDNTPLVFFTLAFSVSFLLILISLMIFKKFLLFDFILVLLFPIIYVVYFFMSDTLSFLTPYIDYYLFGSGDLIVVLTLLGMIVVGVKYKAKHRVFKYATLYEQTTILVYLDYKYKPLEINSEFFKDYNRISNFKEWISHLKVVECSGKQFKPKDFFDIFQDDSNAFDINIIMEDNSSISKTIVKKEVVYNNEIIGYILVDHQKLITENFRQRFMDIYDLRFFNYMTLINEPIAYFDSYKKIFVLTPKMQETLGIDKKMLTVEKFKEFVFSEDQVDFVDCVSGANRYFNLHTTSGFQLFENRSYIFDNEVYNIIRYYKNISENKVEIKAYDDLIKAINKSFSSYDFGLIVLSFKHIEDIKVKYGEDYAALVLIKFFQKANNGVLRNKLNVFKLNNSDYALLVNRQDDLHLIIRDLEKQTSDLLNANIIIDYKKFDIKPTLGICLVSTLPIKSAELAVKAALEATEEAKRFNKNFVLYTKKR